MENEDQAENLAVAEESNVPVSPAEETTTSESQETDSQAPEAPAEETQDSERKPKPAERRIRELNDRAKRVEEENQLLRSQMQSPQFPQYQEGETVAPERLQQDVVQTAQAIADITVTQRLAQQSAVNNLTTDTKVLPAENPELNPESSDYIPEMEKAIAEEYQSKAFRVVGYTPTGEPITQIDPSVRLTDIANRHLEVARAAVKKSSANMRNAVAQTADTGGIKPQGESKGEKSVQDMSIAEIEAKYGIVRR